MDFDTTFLDINGISRHLDTAEYLPSSFAYNEKNTGAGFTFENVDDRLVKAVSAGGYKNSFDENSFYLTGFLGRRFGRDLYSDFGAFAGLASGYGEKMLEVDGRPVAIKKGRDIMPLAGVQANFGKEDVGRVTVRYAPGDIGLIMMNLGIPIK